MVLCFLGSIYIVYVFIRDISAINQYTAVQHIDLALVSNHHPPVLYSCARDSLKSKTGLRGI